MCSAGAPQLGGHARADVCQAERECDLLLQGIGMDDQCHLTNMRFYILKTV